MLPLALQYGLTVFDFWDMTIKEINSYIKAIQQREKQIRTNQYLQASMTANFVGCLLNGKPIPPIHEVFPELFQNEANDEAQKEQDFKAMMMYKEQMIDFAKRHNKIRRIKEGENN